MTTAPRRHSHLQSGTAASLPYTVSLGFLLLFAVPVHASDDDHDSDQQGGQLRVETVAEPETPTSDPRHPSGWVTRIRLDDTFGRGRDLGDALERVGGLSVRRRSSLGQPAFASVRGGNPRQLAVHLNGIRIGAPAGVGFDVGGLSTGWLDAVDVYRGAAAASYGSGALTGALDLRTTLPDKTGWRASSTAMSGSFGTLGISSEAAVSGDDLGAEFDASGRQSRGDFRFVDDQSSPHRRVNNGHEQLSLGGTVGAETDVGKLEGTVLYENQRRGAPGPSEFQSSYRRARVDARRSVATLEWRRRGIASGSWGALDARLATGYVNRRLAYDNPEAFLSGGDVHSDADHDAWSAVAGLGAFFAFGNFTHLTLEGRTEDYDADYDWNDASSLQASRQTAAVGVSNELLLFDEKVSIIGGLRGEVVEGDQISRLPLIPSAGAIWRALDWLTFKTNIARTYRVPDFDELYLRTETLRGDPTLEPERALNLDAGVTLGDDGFPLSGRLTGFYNDHHDMILFLPQTAYLFQAQNVGGAVARGLEATAELSAERRYRLRANYTYTDAYLDAVPDHQLARHPRHRGVLGGRLQLAGIGPLKALRSLQLTSEFDARSRVNLDNFGNLTSAPFWQIDLGLTFQPNRALQMGVEVRNVTDNRWGADNLQRPLPGRSLYASLRMSQGTLQE